MQYTSSKGAVEIDMMPLSYAKNALNKLKRTEPERTAEIEALDAHVSKLEAEAMERNTTPQPREAVIGDNGPPPDDEPAEDDVAEPKGRAAVDLHVADLLTEAANWADGAAIENQEQANSVGKLQRLLEQAASLVDNSAAEEKKPFNEAIVEIATWQNGYTAKGLKKTPDGKLTKAILAVRNLSGAWLKKQEDDRKAREKEAADKALAAAQSAIAVREEAKTSTDIAAMDSAEDALAQASALLRSAKGIANERVQAGGGEGFRAVSLRSNWQAHASGEDGCWTMAFNHYRKNPEFAAELRELIQKWANRDARSEAARALGVPGFNFIHEKVAA